jgi:hypothetical protein
VGLVGTQALECAARLESLGKFVQVGRQPWANHAVEPIHTVSLHFPLCFLRRPALFGDPVHRHIHSGTVVADAAVDENLLAWVVAEQGKELREMLISRTETLLRKRDIPHPEAGHELALALA